MGAEKRTPRFGMMASDIPNTVMIATSFYSLFVVVYICRCLCQAFSVQIWATGHLLPMSTGRRWLTRVQMVSTSDDDTSHFNDLLYRQLSRRRTLISAIVLAPALSLAGRPSDAYLNESSSSSISLRLPNLDCLLDLPTLDQSQHVRLYLCRHGQTEYNRIGRIQGNLVPIDDTGVLQAARLGAALARLSNPPETFFHSGLTRSFQTAQVASSVFEKSTTAVRKVRELPELASINVGRELEGETVSSFLTRRMGTYNAWAMGDMEKRLGKGGENAREVFQRIETALQAMVIEADLSPTRSCAAVSHSSLLRVLLAAVGDTPLVQVATIEQKNGCVNVVDVSRSGMARLLDPKSRLFDNHRAQQVSDLDELLFRKVRRVNEKRHLIGLV